MVNFVREERLAKVLEEEVEEDEGVWADFDFEESQVKFDLADLVTDELVDEVAQLLLRFTERGRVEQTLEGEKKIDEERISS